MKGAAGRRGLIVFRPTDKDWPAVRTIAGDKIVRVVANVDAAFRGQSQFGRGFQQTLGVRLLLSNVVVSD